MYRTMYYHKERHKQLEKLYESLSQKIINEYPPKNMLYDKPALSKTWQIGPGTC